MNGLQPPYGEPFDVKGRMTMRIRGSRQLVSFGVAAAFTLFGIFTTTARPAAETIPSKETTLSVRRALERLPYYGVFDFLAFGVDRGAVTLQGYAYQPGLRADAAAAIKRVAGVDEVANRIETLPPSQNDDRIRWTTFYRIYTDDFLSRYAPGGAVAARMAAYEFARFPGLQPSGTYPIHIIVKGGRTTLIGVVDNAGDRQLAEVRAREVTGVFAVENELIATK
jgi:hyperosmotically inducible protein